MPRVFVGSNETKSQLALYHAYLRQYAGTCALMCTSEFKCFFLIKVQSMLSISVFGNSIFRFTHFNSFISVFRDLFRRFSIGLAAVRALLLHGTLSAQSSSVWLAVFCLPYAVTLRHLLYSRTPLMWPLVIRIANYSDRLGPSGKHFPTVTVLHFLMA